MGRLCDISERLVWKLRAAARLPAPIHLGGRTLWRRAEIERWIEAGCPDRERWEAMRREVAQ